jgi:uncharacterized protein (DUF1778 family)
MNGKALRRRPPEIKVRPDDPALKELFQRAAERDKRSLSSWMLVAGIEKAKRAGLAVRTRKSA